MMGDGPGCLEGERIRWGTEGSNPPPSSGESGANSSQSKLVRPTVAARTRRFHLETSTSGRAKRSGFYADYAAQPATHLGRALAGGFAYQGQSSSFRGGRPRGEPSAALPATAFVAFLQNHDAVGNQPFGTRLSTRAADPALHASIAIVLLSPQIPLLFMGEEWGSEQPFCSSAILSQAWRRGARGQAQGICPFPGIPR